MDIFTGTEKDTENIPKMTETPLKGDVIREKWMFIIDRYPSGQTFPVKFFKLGADYKRTVPKPKKGSKVTLSDKSLDQEDLL